jgi:hypothetical protein
MLSLSFHRGINSGEKRDLAEVRGELARNQDVPIYFCFANIHVFSLYLNHDY